VRIDNPLHVLKGKIKRGERMRVGHTARSNHSDHDLPHTEVRARHAATSKKKKGSEEVGGEAKVKEGEKNGCVWVALFSLPISTYQPRF
jgi:hypothetical protein